MNFFDLVLNLRKRVNYFNLTKKARVNVKWEIYMKIIFYLNLYFNTYGLQIEKIELSKYESEIIYNFNDDDLTIEKKKSNYSSFKKKFKVNEHLENAQKIKKQKETQERIYLHQKAIDKSNLSNLAYKKFRKIIFNNVNCNLISPNRLLIMRNRMSRFFTIKTNSFGCFVDCQEKITFVLKKIYEKLEKNISDNIFKIHLSGDGCTITKTKFNLVNFCFKVLNDNDESTSGLYTLGKYL
jgi:hypothetical protein